MHSHLVKVKSIDNVTHDVLKIITEKPQHYIFKPGQATEVCINKPGWQKDRRPFTFTSLPENNYLEFTIKIYPEHKGVTNQLLQLKEDDELILHDVFGAIHYTGEGVFIAGGAGITPFISIFRHLDSINALGNNKLIFANKARVDIILEQEFEKMLGKNFINILSDENTSGYASGQITADFIEENSDGLNKTFYICGPPLMMDAMKKNLTKLEVPKHSIIIEKF